MCLYELEETIKKAQSAYESSKNCSAKEEKIP
jgi:hypothetical protein